MTEKTAQATSLRLSQTVRETVADDGIEATTVRRVAARAKCTTGLLMHHFGSRLVMLSHARQLLYTRTASRADNAEALRLKPRDTLFEVLSGTLPLDAERQQEARVWMGFAAATLPDKKTKRSSRFRQPCLAPANHTACNRMQTHSFIVRGT